MGDAEKSNDQKISQPIIDSQRSSARDSVFNNGPLKDYLFLFGGVEISGFLFSALGFSVVINLLLLVTPFYMLQVYDRVLTSGSYDTLTVLTLIAVFLLIIYVAADGGRKRAFALSGQALGEIFETPLFKQALTRTENQPSELAEPIKSLSKLQGFLLNGGAAPIFDAPFSPLFLGLLFLIHPMLGVIGLVGGAILIFLAMLTDFSAKAKINSANERDAHAQSLLAHSIRHRPAIIGMGMVSRLSSVWREEKAASMSWMIEGANRAGFLAASSRSLRQILQIFVLGAGAFLALQQEISPGAIIAGSILLGRALGPIDLAVAQWKHLLIARKAVQTVSAALTDNPADNRSISLPRPKPILKFADFAIAAPGIEAPLTPQFNLDLKGGDLLAIVGPSGSGKTTLLQTVAGAIAPQAGSAQLGGVNIHAWPSDDRGDYIGYLPQQVDILTSTVAKNIARLHAPNEERLFRASTRLNCHEMIASLPQAYDTPVGAGGCYLSAGQQQMLGLARAFYGDPALLLLDEPTAHLDMTSAAHFISALNNYVNEEGIALVATHDRLVIEISTWVLTIQNKRIALSSRDEYLASIAMQKSKNMGEH